MFQIETRQRDTIYRMRVARKGGHLHVRVFSKYLGQSTWAGIGTLCIAEDEAMSFFALFGKGVEILEDEVHD